MKQPKKQTQDLTAGERLSFEIARLFPESFHVWGERISVRDEAGTEASRAMVRENLEQLHERDQHSGKKQRKNREKIKDK
jgi:hypothetical protein